MPKMPQSTNRQERIQLRVTEETISKLDALAEETGVSRLALGALALAIGLNFVQHMATGVVTDQTELAQGIWAEVQNMAAEQVDVMVERVEAANARLEKHVADAIEKE